MLRGARCPIEDEETAVRETFQGLDLNHDGKVSFAEFVHAALMGNFVGGTPASPPKLPPIPPDSSAPPTMAEMDSEEAEIRGIYERYNPAKLADLPRLLAKYRAGEGLSVMLERLKIKYHVAPSEEEAKLPTFGKKPSTEPPGGSTPWYQRAASTGSSEGRVPEQAVGGEAGGQAGARAARRTTHGTSPGSRRCRTSPRRLLASLLRWERKPPSLACRSRPHREVSYGPPPSRQGRRRKSPS